MLREGVLEPLPRLIGIFFRFPGFLAEDQIGEHGLYLFLILRKLIWIVLVPVVLLAYRSVLFFDQNLFLSFLLRQLQTCLEEILRFFIVDEIPVLHRPYFRNIDSRIFPLKRQSLCVLYQLF